MWIREYENPKYKCHDEYFKNNAISVLFIGGIHGNEVNTIMAIGRKAKMPHPHSNIDPHIRKVGFIPCANFDVFRMNLRGVNKDVTDLNRGWFNSNYRERLEEVMKGYDVIIDCHCSEDIAPLFYLSTHQPATDVCAMVRYFEREQLNYALSCNTNDTIKLVHTQRSTYHPQTGYYRKQLSITWEENGMKYNPRSVESTERMINDMLGHYAYKLYRDALIQELIDTPPISTFRTVGFICSTREGVFIYPNSSRCSYNSPIESFRPNEPMNVGYIREFDIHGHYGNEYPACADYLVSNVETRVFEINGRGMYVTEGTRLASYQPSNADKFPESDIRNASHTYIPAKYAESTIMQLSAEINKKR